MTARARDSIVCLSSDRLLTSFKTRVAPFAGRNGFELLGGFSLFSCARWVERS